MRLSVLSSSGAIAGALLTLATSVLAQTPPIGTGAPPTDLAATVTAPKGPGDGPKPYELSVDSTDAALSAGGQFATGNSRQFAATALGKFNIRRGANAFGASLLGNYAEAFVVPTSTVPGTPAEPGSWQRSTENLQGKLRYDRYLSRSTSLFVQVTGTHDAFQAITFRLNADPGVKYLFVNDESVRLWGEAGYDFQFDDNFTAADGIEQAGSSGPALDANGLPYVIARTDTIESSRLFAGFHYAFNKEVQLNLGLEYLQGFGGSGGGNPAIPAGYTAATVDAVPISLTASRVNVDALLAAHVGAGLSIGVGFTAKYNSAPLPGKVDLDTSGTLALIYAFSSPAAKSATCPCPPDAPAPPPPPPVEVIAIPPPLPAPPPPAPPSSPLPSAAPTAEPSPDPTPLSPPPSSPSVVH
jgi:putative salt-induced outer membrane protein